MITGSAWHLVGAARCRFPSLVLSLTPTRGLPFRVRRGRQRQEAGLGNGDVATSRPLEAGLEGK